MSVASGLPIAVAGGGCAGYTAAILLAAGGAHVELLEARSDADAATAGSGIMLQANALRVLRTAGVLPAVQAAGYGFDSTGIRLPDPTGRLVAEMTDGRRTRTCRRRSVSPGPT